MHLLNAEHTFCVSNSFIIGLLLSIGFRLTERINYKGHSVVLYFNRVINYCPDRSLKIPSDCRIDTQLTQFIKNIRTKVSTFNRIISTNPLSRIFLWPASAHSLTLVTFGLEKSKIAGFVDNSMRKVGKYMYSTDLKVHSLEMALEGAQDTILLLNGGVFTSEFTPTLDSKGIRYFVSDPASKTC